MEIRIIEEHPNPLLKRTEYRFEVDHTGTATPKRDEVRSELAKLAKVPKERLIVERMEARFGTAKSRGEAFAYQTKEAVDMTVREHILVRNGLKEKAAKGAPAAAAEGPAPPAEKAAEAAGAAPPKEKSAAPAEKPKDKPAAPAEKPKDKPAAAAEKPKEK